MSDFPVHLAQCPIIAILRGLEPDRAVEVAGILLDAGIRILEVPLNSPRPFESISSISRRFPEACTGAGTVIEVADVERVRDAGGSIVVSPVADPDVIARALALGMTPLPGFLSATEAVRSIRAGARCLKLFPASAVAPDYLRSLLAVLPPATELIPVGGVRAADLTAWQAAGAAAFGFGSDLFKPKFSLEEIRQRASILVRAVTRSRREAPEAHRV